MAVAGPTKRSLFPQGNEKASRQTNQPFSHIKEQPTMSEANKAVASLQSRLLELDPLPTLFDNAQHQDHDPRRLSLFRETKELLIQVEASVKRGTIRPSRKHGPDLSHSLGCFLSIFSATPPIEGHESPFRQCSRVLTLLEDWNLDLQPHHYECAIIAAAREQLWKEASELFWLQIDPDASGYIPMNMSFSDPVGLYSIARHAQSEGGAATERIMDAILRMSMVSPTDQQNYVLAAGVALGLAGEWKSCIDYLETSYHSTRLGWPLVAAAMHACILCDRHDEALELYRGLLDGPSLTEREWQWGGGSSTLDPVIRDLAMRACGGRGPVSDLAIKLFREVEHDGPISIHALKGVLTACEQEGNWEESVIVLFSVIDKLKDPAWLVTSNESTSIFHLETDHPDEPPSFHTRVGDALLSVMRVCNEAGHFGTALLCGRLVDLAFFSMDSDRSQMHHMESKLKEDGTELEESWLPLVFGLSQNEDILVCIMVSLCGLGCSHGAVKLYKMALGRERDHNKVSSPEHTRWSGAEECYRMALSLSAHLDKSQDHQPIHRLIHRLTAAIHDVANSGDSVSQEQREILAAAVTSAMHGCTATGHSETGILLAWRVEKVVSASSASGTVSNLLKWYGDDAGNNFLLQNDSVVAAINSAYQASCWSVQGKLPPGTSTKLSHLLQKILKNSTPSSVPKEGLSTWIANQALCSMVSEGAIEDAGSVYRAMDENTRNPETFYHMARAFVEDEKVHDAWDVYTEALDSGCMSEALALLMLRAVVESKEEMKIKTRVLRRIGKDCAGIAGLDLKQWLRLRYWSVKRQLGQSDMAGLLLSTNSMDAPLIELEMAMQGFVEREKLLLQPTEDVVECIIRGERLFNEPAESGGEDDSRYRLELILRVLEESRILSIHEDPNFVTEVVLALRALRCNDGCIDYVRGAVSHGAHLSDMAINEAMLAAAEEGDAGFIQQLEELFPWAIKRI